MSNGAHLITIHAEIFFHPRDISISESGSIEIVDLKERADEAVLPEESGTV